MILAENIGLPSMARELDSETALVFANDQIRITPRRGQELEDEIQRSSTALAESEDGDDGEDGDGSEVWDGSEDEDKVDSENKIDNEGETDNEVRKSKS